VVRRLPTTSKAKSRIAASGGVSPILRGVTPTTWTPSFS